MIWNRNDWQGRSEEQVKRNYKVFGWSLVFVVVLGLLLYLTTII
jgi:hypothetical protein